MTWRQRWCGIRYRHDRVLAFIESAVPGVPPRMVLRCTSCQHDSPGLRPAPRPPVVKYEGDPRRHQLVTCRLVGIRKSA